MPRLVLIPGLVVSLALLAASHLVAQTNPAELEKAYLRDKVTTKLEQLRTEVWFPVKKG